MRSLTVAVLACMLVGCEGPMGPAGPQGERGEQGEPGSPTVYFYSGALSADGMAAHDLPTDAGTPDRLPSVTCYLAETEAGPWTVMGSAGSGSTFCGVAVVSGVLRVYIVAISPPSWEERKYEGWRYQIIVRPQE